MYKSLSDQSLVEKTIAGDSKAFEFLYIRHYQQLVTFVSRFAPKQAEDISQETFIKAFNSLSTYLANASFKTWLFTIGKNTAIDELRKKKEELFSKETDLESRIGFDDNEHIELTIELNSMLPKMEYAISILPEEQKTVLRLREEENLSYTQIAESMQIPVGTVMSRLYYARQKVQAVITSDLSIDNLVLLEKRKRLNQKLKRLSHRTNLSSSDIKKTHRGIYNLAQHLYHEDYGPAFWEQALVDAGLDLDQIVKQRRWDKERIRVELLKRRNSELPINRGAIKREYPTLEKAIARRYTDFDDAIKDIGINPDEIRLRVNLSDDQILERIKSLQRQEVNLNETELRGSEHKSLVDQARKPCHFGSWAKAVETAGFDYIVYRKKNPHNTWNEEKVISDIQELGAQKIPLDSTFIIKEYNELYKAAYRYVGSWGKAVEAAGIDYEEIKKIKRKRT